jgi:hypothetical protein
MLFFYLFFCVIKDKQDYEVLSRPLRQSILQIIDFKDKILL